VIALRLITQYRGASGLGGIIIAVILVTLVFATSIREFELKPIKVILAPCVISSANNFVDRISALTSDGLYYIIAKLVIG
jgi:hypothetical protein